MTLSLIQFLSADGERGSAERRADQRIIPAGGAEFGDMVRGQGLIRPQVLQQHHEFVTPQPRQHVAAKLIGTQPVIGLRSQTLRPGNLVTTACGRTLPIRWIGLTDDWVATPSTVAALQARERSGKGQVVDDEPLIVQVHERILSRAGYHVTVAHDGLEAQRIGRIHLACIYACQSAGIHEGVLKIDVIFGTWVFPETTNFDVLFG